jgi:hypothetical protein
VNEGDIRTYLEKIYGVRRLDIRVWRGIAILVVEHYVRERRADIGRLSLATRLPWLDLDGTLILFTRGF